MNQPMNPRAVLPLERGMALFWFVVLVLLLLVILVVALVSGSYSISVATLWAWVQGQADPTATAILAEVRVPRVLVTVFAGAALGLAGPLLQSGFRTSLADPYLLGLAGFAAIGAVLAQGGLFASLGLPVMASLAAGLAVVLVAQFSRDASTERRALMGVALAAMSVAGLSILLAINASPSSSNVIGWVVGGFALKGWPQLQAMLLPGGLALALGLSLGRVANLLQLGDEVAENLGLNASLSRALTLATAAVLTGVAVGTAGLLGFVGLLAVGIARSLLGTDYRRLLPAACLIGASLVALSDVLGRMVLAPNEIPAGVFTTLLGGVYLVFLARRAV
jgi:ABC-type Fe3+-siderophore transport system permease subunit